MTDCEATDEFVSLQSTLSSSASFQDSLPEVYPVLPLFPWKSLSIALWVGMNVLHLSPGKASLWQGERGEVFLYWAVAGLIESRTLRDLRTLSRFNQSLLIESLSMFVCNLRRIFFSKSFSSSTIPGSFFYKFWWAAGLSGLQREVFSFSCYYCYYCYFSKQR